MPTLLRLAIATIAFVGLMTSPILLILTGSGSDDGVGTVVSVVALCALWVTPTVAGTLVSAWSTNDAESARRVRRVVAICAATTVVGAAVFLSAAGAAGDVLWIAVVITAVALATFPASIAIGAAARRAELRRDPPADDSDEELAAVDAEIRRGRRRGAIGAGIGLVIAIVGDVLLSLTLDGEHDQVLTLVAFAVAFAVIGASVGRITVVFRLAQRTRDLLGSDYGVARRIGRIVRGKDQASSPEEEERAARYARIAIRTVPFQSRSSLLTVVAVVAIQLPTVIDKGFDPIRIFIFALFAVTVVVIVPLQAAQTRRIRRFSAAHPVAAPTA